MLGVYDSPASWIHVVIYLALFAQSRTIKPFLPSFLSQCHSWEKIPGPLPLFYTTRNQRKAGWSLGTRLELCHFKHQTLIWHTQDTVASGVFDPSAYTATTIHTQTHKLCSQATHMPDFHHLQSKLMYIVFWKLLCWVQFSMYQQSLVICSACFWIAMIN